ncbi:MAG: RNB domain-containing ribonuclease [Thermoplasmatota archaeon]
MKPGDLVEFKSGAHGIAAPKNLGVYVEREKRGKDFFVVLYTVKGKKEFRPDAITGRKLAARIDGPLDDKTLEDRLKALLAQFASGALDEKKPLAAGELDDRVLWNHAVNGGEGTPEDFARRWVKHDPSRGDIEAVRNVLATCARPGVGFFERIAGRGENWRPLPVEDFRAVKRDEEGFHKLRKKLIVAEEVPPENDWDRPKTVFRGVKVADAGLDETDRARLETVYAVMRSFILHDRDTGEVGILSSRTESEHPTRGESSASDAEARVRGAVHAQAEPKQPEAPPRPEARRAPERGAPVVIHTLDGFSLFTFTRWLAIDWCSATRASLSSNFVQFLVENGAWSLEEAIVAVAQRKVLAVPGFSWEPDPHAAKAADRVEERVSAEGRADFRADRTWTIDPADAKDHDDAVAYRREPDGTHVLDVHIADVAHYVAKDDALDRAARTRATSVYLPTGVLPMLPSRLSDGLCSLNAGVDRYALTARLRYDADANLVGEEFFESIIRVAGNVSYEEVLAAIERSETESSERGGGVERAEPITGNRLPVEDAREFAAMEAFARQLDAKRRGLVLETAERRVRVSGEVLTHAMKEGSRATKMIEVFMVAANEAVARKLTAANVPLPYRCHPLPDRASVERFNHQMETMELPIAIELPERAAAEGTAPETAPEHTESFLDALKKGGKLTLTTGGFLDSAEDAESTEDAEDDATTPLLIGLAQLSRDEQDAWLKPFRDALATVRGVKDERRRELVYVKSLSCMGRAIYTTRNLGHFGLGSECYCHFTSPIRRYADLLVHRQLKAVLRGEEVAHDAATLEDLALHCSQMSAAADDLERSVVDSSMVFAARRSQLTGEGAWQGTQSGLVNGVTKGGLFLSLPRGLEARLASADIPNGPWDVDPWDSMLMKSADREVTEKNWRELLDEKGDATSVFARLGDDLAVSLASFDYVDGRVGVKLAAATEP